MAEITIRISDRVQKTAAIALGAICVVLVVCYGWSTGVLVPKYRL
jgi:hypothetical protein